MDSDMNHKLHLNHVVKLSYTQKTFSSIANLAQHTVFRSNKRVLLVRQNPFLTETFIFVVADLVTTNNNIIEC